VRSAAPEGWPTVGPDLPVEAAAPPPRDQQARTIFMPLVMDAAKGPAAENKDYRPVEADWLGGDIYRVVSLQPQNERWEYPSGATVFAVVLHPGEAMVIIVAPYSDPKPAPGEPSPTSAESQQTGYSSSERRDSMRPARFVAAASGKTRSVRFAHIAIMTVMLVATGFGGAQRYLDLPLHPADPIRASVVASCFILIGALLQVRDLSEFRIVGAAFALSLIVGAVQI
jgi:hypothetical protein